MTRVDLVGEASWKNRVGNLNQTKLLVPITELIEQFGVLLTTTNEGKVFKSQKCILKKCLSTTAYYHCIERPGLGSLLCH